ncbi:MAG: hypothetical protein ABIK36_16000 [Pseudomonadota bacterium]
MGVTRRSVLGLGIAAAALPGLSRAAPAAPAAFLGQSGEPQTGRLVLGLLVADDETALRQAVFDLRTKLSYRRVLRQRSTDRYKLAFARALIDALAERPDTRFAAVAFDLPPWPKPGAARDRLVREAFAEALAAAPAGAAVSLVDNGDRAAIGTLVHALPSAQSARVLRFARIGDDDLLQVAALLTGLANPSRARSRSTKGELVAHLRLSLGVGEISARALSRHPRFSVRSVKV